MNKILSDTTGKTFILPTRHGYYFLSVAFIVFFISLSYANNLSLSTSFLFVSVILTGAVFTNENLSKVQIESVRFRNGVSGQAAVDVVVINGSGSKKFNMEVSLVKFCSAALSLNPREKGTLSIPLRLPRGRYGFKKITLMSGFPFGLFCSWKNCAVFGHVYVYPETIQHKIPLPEPLGSGAGDRTSVSFVRGSDEFFGHQNYIEGDSWRQVDWKAWARERGLLSKIFEENSSRKFLFDFAAIPLKSDTHKLEQLACWLEQAEGEGAHYQMLFPGLKLDWGAGPEHFLNCMCHLSSWKADYRR